MPTTGRHRLTDPIDTGSATDPADTDTMPIDTAAAAAPGNALEIRGVRKVFTSGLARRGRVVTAVDNLDLTIPAGTVHALLGPNGAGKTTTVRMVATLLRPDAGTVTVDGIDAVGEPDRAREIIGVSGQYAAVDGTLTGFENLRMVAQLYGHRRRDASRMAREMIADLGLDDAADRPMRTYSGGMRRRLDLAGALINHPRLVILDEPTTGLDPRGRRQIWDLIAAQVDSGTTVLLTTQYLEEADTLADEITVIDHGRIRAQGSADELKNSITPQILTAEFDGEPTPAQSAVIARTLAAIGVGTPNQSDATTWTVPVADGAADIPDAVRALDAGGASVRSVSVAGPTLDDVFLHLTDRSVDADPAETTTHLDTREPADVH